MNKAPALKSLQLKVTFSAATDGVSHGGGCEFKAFADPCASLHRLPKGSIQRASCPLYFYVPGNQ